MKICAIVVFAVAILSGAAVAVAEEVPTTAAARPSDAFTVPGHGFHVVAGDGLSPTAIPEELERLLGSKAYPGAPTAEDVGYTGPRCEIDPGPCDYLEDEPICADEWVDSYNGGCNSAPAVFDTISPQYGVITLVGTSGTYLVGGGSSRDTDWYEIHISEPTEITFCCTAEFPLQTVLIDGTTGCGSFEILAIQDTTACEELCVTQTVGPGVFWLWVGTSVYDGVPCGEEYVMTLEGHNASDCVIDCPGGAIVENEPPCGPDYLDSWNAGCNAVPNVFQHLEPNGRPITVCGEAGVFPYLGTCSRDTDWYEITLDQTRVIECCGYAEFPLMMFVLGGTCDALWTFDYAVTDACQVACMSDTLEPGTYWLWMGPTGWSPTDCSRRYTMTVSGYTTPVETTSWGTIKAMYR
jgi:hypothetical protein